MRQALLARAYRSLGERRAFADNFARAITPKTKLLYAETIGNPSMNVLDIEKIVLKFTGNTENLFTQSNTNRFDALTALVSLGFDKKSVTSKSLAILTKTSEF